MTAYCDGCDHRKFWKKKNKNKKKTLKGTRILFCGRGRPNNIFHPTKVVLTLNSTLYFLFYFSAQYPKRYNYLNTLNVFFIF